MTQDWQIASAAELTLTSLAELFAAGFAGYAIPLQMTAETLAERIYAEDVDLAASRILWSGGTALGMALIARRGWVSRLAAMGVVTAARARGVGRALLDRVLDEARARGDRRMRLEVLEANAPARALYQRSGFRRVQRLVGYEAAAPEPQPAALEEVDPASFARHIPEGLPLPWQLERASLSAPPASARCFALEGKSFAYLSAVTTEAVSMRGILTLPEERRRGHARKLVHALAAQFPARRLFFPAFVPEGLAAPFWSAAGLRQSALTQLELALELS